MFIYYVELGSFKEGSVVFIVFSVFYYSQVVGPFSLFHSFHRISYYHKFHSLTFPVNSVENCKIIY